MKQLVKPWYGAEASAGACLYMAQLVVGAGDGPYSATVAANATKHRHHDRSFPRTSIAVVWFSHWGTYTDYRNNERRYEDWGHVVTWDPTAFDRAGGFFSSRRNGTGGGEWFRTITDVERSFSSTFRFWSEDINGVRVCEPAPAKPATKPKPKPKLQEDDDMAEPLYIANDKQKTQGQIYRLHPITGKKRKVPSAEWSALRAVEAATGVKLQVGFLAEETISKIPNG